MLASILLTGLSLLIGFMVGYIFRTKQVGRDIMNSELNKQYRSDMRKLLGKETVQVPSEIGKISNRFVEIHRQSLDALQDGYNEVAGIGFGKSLEILIKDYAIYLNSSQRENIEKDTLSNCIKKYLDDESLKNSAELATWLRNDEAHYKRKWENKDVNDLVNLITLIVVLIQSSQTKLKLDESVAKVKATFVNN